MRLPEAVTEQCLETVVVNLWVLNVDMVPHCHARIHSQPIHDAGGRISRRTAKNLKCRTEDGVLWPSGFLDLLVLGLKLGSLCHAKTTGIVKYF